MARALLTRASTARCSPGYWHYRLRQFGLDSTQQYSPVQSVLVLSRESWFRLLWFILGRQLYIYMDARDSGRLLSNYLICRAL